jgi:hypothetical protein
MNDDVRRCESVGCRFGMGSTSNNTNCSFWQYNVDSCQPDRTQKCFADTSFLHRTNLRLVFRDSTEAGTPWNTKTTVRDRSNVVVSRGISLWGRLVQHVCSYDIHAGCCVRNKNLA